MERNNGRATLILVRKQLYRLRGSGRQTSWYNKNKLGSCKYGTIVPHPSPPGVVHPQPLLAARRGARICKIACGRAGSDKCCLHPWSSCSEGLRPRVKARVDQRCLCHSIAQMTFANVLALSSGHIWKCFEASEYRMCHNVTAVPFLGINRSTKIRNLAKVNLSTSSITPSIKKLVNYPEEITTLILLITEQRLKSGNFQRKCDVLVIITGLPFPLPPTLPSLTIDSLSLIVAANYRTSLVFSYNPVSNASANFRCLIKTETFNFINIAPK
ncbi:hypothetical protein J6590_020845 [Homalodisca vitripennis]|nr:hypothetical protein J6590_020845 [Homalodisca vitripennis]